LSQLSLPLPRHPQHQQLSNLTIDDDDDDIYVDDDITYGRNRQREKFGKLKQNLDDDEPLSDYVTVRLALARAKAIAKYRELHA
jgi:hypothetical protein